MSSDEALTIQVNDLSKAYQLYDTPQDRFKALLMPSLNKYLGRQDKEYGQQVSALQPLSFQVKRGTTLGIIGANGSGKSTLLQLLCGTLTPTTGSVEVKGRIAALLELGAGFNTEFTGRENIVLNASILGLTDNEIEARMADIIDFADIGAFIDQPVKVYSSGMYVRLAFSIMAHVDADVLVIDEALAVGDAAFTQKCMRYIRDFKRNGTLIFVSHDTAAVQNLCDQCIWLNQGEMMAFGDSNVVTTEYLKFSLQKIYGDDASLNERKTSAEDGSIDTSVVDYEVETTFNPQLEVADGWQTGHAEITSVTLEATGSGPQLVYEGGEKVTLTIQARAIQAIEKPILGFYVKDRLGQVLFGENTLSYTDRFPQHIAEDGLVTGTFTFRLPMLPNGEYAMTVSIADGELLQNIQHHFLHDAVILNVSSSKVRWGLVGISYEEVKLEKTE